MKDREDYFAIREAEPVILQHKPFINSKNSSFNQSHKSQHQKYCEPSSIVPPNTIVDPRTVMIVSINTCLAEIAMVASWNLVSSAFGTERRRQMFEKEGLFLLWAKQKRDVEDRVEDVEYDCGDDIGEGEVDDGVGWDGGGQEHQDEPEDKHEAGVLFLVDCFLVAEDFYFVQAGSLFVQNSGQLTVIPLFSDKICCLPFIVYQRSVSTFQQQPLYHLILALFYSSYQRCFIVLISMVDVHLFQSHQQPNYLYTPLGSRHIQRCLSILIPLLKINVLIVKIQQRSHLIALRTHMHQILPHITLIKQIPPQFLKVLYHLHIPIKASVMHRQIPFMIRLINPRAQIHLELLCLINPRRYNISVPIVVLLDMTDQYFHVLEQVVECAMMEQISFELILHWDQIQLRVRQQVLREIDRISY